MTKKIHLKINLSFLAVALLPFLALLLLFYLQAKNNIRIIAIENLSNLSSGIGTEVEHTTFLSQTYIKALADNPIIRSPKSSLTEKNYELQKMLNYFKLFEKFTLLDKDGSTISSTAAFKKENFQNTPWFEKALKGQIAVSPVYTEITPHKKTFLTVAAPILGTNNLVSGVLTGQINMEKIGGLIDNIQIGKTGFMFLYDSQGKILSCPDKEKISYPLSPENLRKKILSEPYGFIENIQIKGKNKICYYKLLHGYQDYEGKKWRIGILQDQKETFALLKNIHLQLLIITGLGILFILFLSLFFSHKITKPLYHLKRFTEEISESKLDHQNPISFTKEKKNNMETYFQELTQNIQQTTVSKNYANSITRYMNDILVVLDKSLKIITVNKATCNLLGYSENELIGKSIELIFNDKPGHLLPETSLNQILIEENLRQHKTFYRDKKGNQVPILLNTSVVKDKKDSLLYIVCIATNISAQYQSDKTLKELEKAQQRAELAQKQLNEYTKEMEYMVEAKTKQLVLAEKMSGMGEFAIGIVEELSQPLTIIKLSSQNIAWKITNKVLDMETLKKSLKKDIENQADRMAEMINHIKMFGRHSETEFQKHNLNDIVKNALMLLRIQLKRAKIELHENFTAKLPLIYGDAKLLEEVVLSLIANAKEAMKGRTNKELYLTTARSNKTNDVYLEIRDTGCGISKKNIEKIFQPFFTTKSPGRGTGLGLAICYGIIKTHNGSIKIKSEENKGSSVDLILPIAE